MTLSRAHRRRRVAARTNLLVGAFSAALGGIALLGYLAIVRDVQPTSATFHISWLALTAGFILSDHCAIHVEFGDDAHSFNLNELPFVLGLFLCDLRLLLVARLLAAVVVLAFVQRQTLVKLVFNTCLAALESVIIIAIFVSLRPLVGDGPASWGIAIAATSGVTIVQAITILTAVRLSGGNPEPRQALTTAVFGFVSAAATASLGIAGVALLEVNGPAGIAIMFVIASVLFAAYRGYAIVSQRYANVTKLYGFTKSLARSPEFDSALRLTLLEACDLLRAEGAELCLRDPNEPDGAFVRARCDAGRVDIGVGDEDFHADWARHHVIECRRGIIVPRSVRSGAASRYLTAREFRDLAVVPLAHANAIVGTLAVYNRRGEVSTFDDDDLTVFETFANHASVSLENAELIGKLRREVAERRYQAEHDPLTDLANRSLLAERADRALAERLDSEFVAVLLMDLNRFKDVNDTLGHQHGDALLCEVASRLVACAPSDATIARLGGDEFAMLLPHLTCVDQATAIADRIQHAIRQPIEIGDLHLAVTGSIGVAVAPADGETTPTLLQHADIAMYQSKNAADTGVALYDTDQNQHSQRRLTLAADLRDAIDADALDIYYQPKADLATGKVVGVEALLRWQHPTYGAVPPDEFVPLAEHTGLIRPMTLLVLRRALAQLRDWNDIGLTGLHMAVNLSARSLLSVDLADDIERALRFAGTPRHALTLELTETQMITDPTRTVAVLDRLSAMGVDISVDDFGTGYSSLSYLQRLPVDELKIDRSFVLDMTTNDAKLKIVQTIIDLGRNLNLRVVAEGIEDAITWDTLARLGCDVGQGYFLSRPVPPESLTPWLATRIAGPREEHNDNVRALHIVS
jgi:diguanylate cyclase (GGDEF)-like protein